MDTGSAEDREAHLVGQAYRFQLVAEFALRCAAATGPEELAHVTAEGALAIAGADAASVWLVDLDDRLSRAACAGTVEDPSAEPDERVLAVAAGGYRPDPDDGRTTLPIGRHGVLDVVRSDHAEQGGDLTGLLRQVALLLGVMLERSRRYQRVVDLSEHDPLTGLLNRRRLGSDLGTEVELTRRGRGPVAFVLLDMDHFKACNDRLGHAEGDRALIRLADAVRQGLRAGDTAYRYGGEEFALVLRRTDAAEAMVAAERLRTDLAHALAPWSLTVSLGVASLPGDGHDAESLLVAADRALYAAKSGGRDQVRRAGDTTARLRASS